MGKVAVITGANHGIGAAIAKELAFNGYRVVIAWLNPDKHAYSHIDQVRMVHAMGGEDEADRIRKEIAGNGGQVASCEWRSKTEQNMAAKTRIKRYRIQYSVITSSKFIGSNHYKPRKAPAHNHQGCNAFF